MADLVHFEISVDDLKRAARFYSRVFGWTIAPEEGIEDYLFIKPAAGSDLSVPGGLVRREDPSEATMVTFSVRSFANVSQRIAQAGGKVLEEGDGYVHYCEDTEGNLFAIVEADADVL